MPLWLTGETAFFAVYDRQRPERMYVAASSSHRSVQFVPQLFTWLPLHATASAMAIVAQLPESDRRDLYSQGLPLFAGRRPATSTIEKNVTSIRFDGFALSRDQADVGASAIAAPVWIAGTVAGSVGVAVPNQRFSESGHGNLANHVVQTAEIISRRLGDPRSALDGAS